MLALSGCSVEVVGAGHGLLRGNDFGTVNSLQQRISKVKQDSIIPAFIQRSLPTSR